MARGKNKKKKVIKALHGTLTVELSYLLPLLFMVILLIIYTVFYYHDKNVLMGAVCETAVLSVQLNRTPGEVYEVELDEFCQDRLKGKLILFSDVEVEVTKSKNCIEVSAFAEKGNRSVYTVQRAFLTEPEKLIRQKKILESMINQED